MQGGKEITTGSHLHPVFFEMLHAFSQADLDTILPNLKRFDQIPIAIIDKCLRIYIKQEMPAMPDEDIDRILADAFDEPFREYSGFESKDEFIKQIEFDKIAVPLVVVAKAMQKALGVFSQWNVAKKGMPNEMRLAIEGVLSSQQVLDSLVWESASESEANEKTRELLCDWIKQASQSELGDFVFAISGSQSLKEGKSLAVYLFNESNSLAAFHTCAKRMDLPNGYGDFETFKSKLERAVAESLAAPPQFV